MQRNLPAKREPKQLTVPPELQAIEKIPTIMDLYSEPLLGFAGPSFTGEIKGGFGGLSIILQHDVSDGTQSLAFNWSPPKGLGKEGQTLHIEHDLKSDAIHLAQVNNSTYDQGFPSLFSWASGREKPNIERVYRGLIRLLLPKMVFSGYHPKLLEHFNGVESKITDTLRKYGLPDPPQILENLKAKALGQKPPEPHAQTQLPGLRKPGEKD